MFMPEYWQNRARFPHDELVKYRGQWVAFSADGRRIVAGAESLSALEDRLEQAGEDAQQLMFEAVPGPDDDVFLGAEELH